mmetsp:Transcript_8817/g.13565  ORF Transcript_8817/g.13565 Transcript_8817/m.13565 type:complete len:88 (-) Transcript_8817:826-1089(-)
MKMGKEPSFLESEEWVEWVMGQPFYPSSFEACVGAFLVLRCWLECLDEMETESSWMHHQQIQGAVDAMAYKALYLPKYCCSKHYNGP